MSCLPQTVILAEREFERHFAKPTMNTLKAKSKPRQYYASTTHDLSLFAVMSMLFESNMAKVTYIPPHSHKKGKKLHHHIDLESA